MRKFKLKQPRGLIYITAVILILVVTAGIKISFDIRSKAANTIIYPRIGAYPTPYTEDGFLCRLDTIDLFNSPNNTILGQVDYKDVNNKNIFFSRYELSWQPGREADDQLGWNNSNITLPNNGTQPVTEPLGHLGIFDATAIYNNSLINYSFKLTIYTTDPSVTYSCTNRGYLKFSGTALTKSWYVMITSPFFDSKYPRNTTIPIQAAVHQDLISEVHIGKVEFVITGPGRKNISKEYLWYSPALCTINFTNESDPYICNWTPRQKGVYNIYTYLTPANVNNYRYQFPHDNVVVTIY